MRLKDIPLSESIRVWEELPSLQTREKAPRLLFLHYQWPGNNNAMITFDTGEKLQHEQHVTSQRKDSVQENNKICSQQARGQSDTQRARQHHSPGSGQQQGSSAPRWH